MNSANMRIDIVHIDATRDQMLQQLLIINDDDAVNANYKETTNILLLYNSDVVVGGALLRVTENLIIVKRMYTTISDHSVIIMRFLIKTYGGIEFDFFKKNQCIKRSHLAWSPRMPAIDEGMNCIKILLYNNQDKITKDIALLLN